MCLPCRTLLIKISFGWEKKSHEVKGWFLRTEVRRDSSAAKSRPSNQVFTADGLTTSSGAEQSVWLDSEYITLHQERGKYAPRS
jgi:uncharacterized protein YacL (UPF0231 family)